MPGGIFWALIWFAATVGGVLLAVLLFILIGVACGSLPGLGRGSVMLECPHCGRQTPSQLPECKHCGRSFREEVAEARPPAIPPKLRR
jgi:C2HC-type zinc finger protein